ncbi:MAG TPA: LuxR C-terminal-related transcriptional regulator [Candidatus Elarobacter sp.]|nr:LuxR C-terminal-related transcriptional regulator [Candidatus Elarobacter sp.]
MENPHVVVYDSELHVESASERIGGFFRQWPGLCSAEDAEVPEAATRFVRDLLAARNGAGGTATGLLRPALVVDVVELARYGRRTIVAAFDRFELRNPVRAAAARYKLTRRERDVLTLLLSGMGATEVARRLGLSEMTIHGYFKKLRQKAGARTLSGMMATLLGWTAVAPF